MNRYFYYNVFLGSMLNLMLYVPHILIKYRYNGAISSMLVAVAIGTGLAYLFTTVTQAFPGKGLPEILYIFFPRAIVIPILLFLAAMWYVASAIAIIAYAVLINRFFNPDTSAIIVLGLLTLVCIYGATRSTLSVMFMMEMGLIINTPLILFILMKSVRSENISWDAIRTIANYWNQMPQLTPIAAASYIFTGYINFSIYNRLTPPNFRLKFRWMIPVFCTVIMLISFFVPIGFHGTETVVHYIYLWSVTSDSLIMNYGFIERVIFVFLILYLNLTLIYTTSGWHQAIEMIKSCFPSNKPDVDQREIPWINWAIATLFAIVSLLYLHFFDEKESFKLASAWLVLRLFAEAGTVFLLFGMTLRYRRKSSL
ncbi:hypothetical protein PAECIP111893_04867 [Paenibacillus plantiphilus]|uniref:Spore germination protein n=1 Tax=Paenibacillus plantiphilus TaxID=2905650 RepID=A0ABN8H039_9BACL|nr:hypothetical protein [Paenibacillus plantiphilus]CAH1222580.1 hypothetical protein PAECIP111893_04867 [Paenibacillus plantiphilus]